MVYTQFTSIHSSSIIVSSKFSLVGARVSISIWHSRLGHPHNKILLHVLNKCSWLPRETNDLQTITCKHCICAKMIQLPFSSSTSISTTPLQLFHSDVWGPSPITSSSSVRLCVTLIDDYTKFTWFFPTKSKSQVLYTFIHFKNTMENLFGHKLKTLRTDCGGEYTSVAFQNFCSSHSIFQQFSCPHSPNKMGWLRGSTYI